MPRPRPHGRNRSVKSYRGRYHLPNLPSGRDRFGLALILPEGVFLGARLYTGGPTWRDAYVDMQSGEISRSVDEAVTFATRRWSLVPVDERSNVGRYDYAQPTI